MKRSLVAFLLALFACETVQAGGPITAKAYTASELNVSAALVSGNPQTINIPTRGYSQATFGFSIATPGTITNLYLTCKGDPVQPFTPGSDPSQKVAICDSTSIFPDMDCRPRRWRWRVNIDGNDGTFTLPIAYYHMRCTWTGDTPGTATISATLQLTNQ